MSQHVITTISPVTNQPILTRQAPTNAELDDLVRRSAHAFTSFSKTTLEQRQKIVSRALDLLDDRQDELAKELTEQMGRPIAYTAKEVSTAVARGRYMLKISNDALADTPGEQQSGFNRYIRRVPLGPVLIIFAWNYPYLIVINSIIPALLSGDTVILKPSPQTPTVAERLSDIFVKAGLPEGVVSYFHCGDFDQIQHIVKNPSIALVSFTGSVAKGRAVRDSLGHSIPTRLILELGGKDSAYIRSDVDVAWAAGEIVDGAIFNSGQSCCSLERIYVHQDIHDEFVAAVQKVLESYRLGDPMDKTTQLGPVVSEAFAHEIRSQVKEALSKGAKDVTPPNQSFTTPPKDGNYVAPTLLIDVDHTMTVMTQETFGPVIPVMKVRDDDQAIELMNDSEFGLTASIWTRDTPKGHELADLVEAGTVFVNRCDFPSPDLAWVGWKNSGHGLSLSKFGFDQFSKLKSYHIKAYPN